MSRSNRQLDDSGTVELPEADVSPLPARGDADDEAPDDQAQAVDEAPDDQAHAVDADTAAAGTNGPTPTDDQSPTEPDPQTHDLLRTDDDGDIPPPPPRRDAKIDQRETKQLVSGDPLLRGPAPTPETRAVRHEAPDEPPAQPDVPPPPPPDSAAIKAPPPPLPLADDQASSVPAPPARPPATDQPPAAKPTLYDDDLLELPAGNAPARRASRGAQIAPPDATAPAPHQTQPAPPPQRAAPVRPTAVAPVPRIAGRRPRVRRVTRVVRHMDPWSVFKVAAVFSFVSYGIGLVAGVLLWNVAYATGTIDNIERGLESTGWSTFELNGGEIFHNAWIGGLFAAVGLTGLAVLVATLFNLITDLVGGLRVTVLEEEVIEKPAAPMRRFANRRQGGASEQSRPPTGQQPSPQTGERSGRRRR